MQECVILLHGLFRSSRSMHTLAKTLESSRFKVINQDYPSTSSTISILAQDAISKALSLCPSGSIIHFVTHSMGAILLRQYLSVSPIPNLHRVVMLGPPNQGSEIVDLLGRLPSFEYFNGPASIELRTDGICNNLPLINFELGVISGTRAFDPLCWLILPKPNDGRVSVQSTKIQGMKEHLVLGVTHTFMMKNSRVIKEVQHFLKEGSFNN